MPLSGVLAARLGCRGVIWAAGLLIAAPLPFLATAASPFLLAVALLVFGAGFGAGGGLCAASGLTVAVLVPSWLVSLGFGMVGLGSSNIVPVFYSALGRQRVMPPNLAARATSLPIAFLVSSMPSRFFV
jgi:hypothetical protein